MNIYTVIQEDRHSDIETIPFKKLADAKGFAWKLRTQDLLLEQERLMHEGDLCKILQSFFGKSPQRLC